MRNGQPDRCYNYAARHDRFYVGVGIRITDDDANGYVRAVLPNGDRLRVCVRHLRMAVENKPVARFTRDGLMEECG